MSDKKRRKLAVENQRVATPQRVRLPLALGKVFGDGRRVQVVSPKAPLTLLRMLSAR